MFDNFVYRCMIIVSIFAGLSAALSLLHPEPKWLDAVNSGTIALFAAGCVMQMKLHQKRGQLIAIQKEHIHGLQSLLDSVINSVRNALDERVRKDRERTIELLQNNKKVFRRRAMDLNYGTDADRAAAMAEFNTADQRLLELMKEKENG